MFSAKVKASRFLPTLKMWTGYKGRTLRLVEGETASIHDWWDEGYRNYPMLFDPLRIRELPWDPSLFTQQVLGNPMNFRMGTLTLRPGVALLENCFSGQHKYLRVTLHPSDFQLLKEEWIS